jgi:hypothetical protein
VVTGGLTRYCVIVFGGILNYNLLAPDWAATAGRNAERARDTTCDTENERLTGERWLLTVVTGGRRTDGGGGNDDDDKEQRRW